MFFNIVKDLFKSIERLSRNGKIQMGPKAEGIIILGGLRKKYLTRCQISRSKYDIYSLTKSVFQHSEGLVQINWAPKEEWESPNGF